MLSITDGYRSAVVGDVRRMLIKAQLEIVDPDITYGTVNSSGAAAFSKGEQLHDKELSLNSRYATLEPGRWVLDGSFRLIPDEPQAISGEVGFVGDVLSGEDGSFASPVYAELTFSNCSNAKLVFIVFSFNLVSAVGTECCIICKFSSAIITKHLLPPYTNTSYISDLIFP